MTVRINLGRSPVMFLQPCTVHLIPFLAVAHYPSVFPPFRADLAALLRVAA